MLIEQPPSLLRRLYPRAEWREDPSVHAVYLTFDEGPIPGMTPWVLDVLDSFGVKATFFLVGDNIRKHPAEFEMVRERGHRLGNHTYNHLKGFACSVDYYMANVAKADGLIHSDLFRPPHGHLTFGQYRALRDKYRIIMWDLVTRDYSRHLTGEEVFAKVRRYARNGSIITFHDSLKSEANTRYALPRSIAWLLEQGYELRLL